MFENHINNAQIKDIVEPNRLTGNGKKNKSSLFTNTMHHLLHNCSNILCIATDPYGIITLFNAGAELSLGFTVDEVVNRLTLTDICDPVDLMKRNDEMNIEFETSINFGFDTVAFIAADGTEDICALTYISKTGRPVHVEVSVNAINDYSGDLVGYMIIGTEKQSIRDNENPLKSSHIKTAHVQYLAKSVIMANLSHEIRNPLNANYDGSELTNSKKTNWVHVINVLEKDFLPLNRSVIKRKLIEQIDYFGKNLILFGEANIFKSLIDYGTKICQHVDNFEIDEMMKTLKLFPGIINKIKSMDHQLAEMDKMSAIAS